MKSLYGIMQSTNLVVHLDDTSCLPTMVPQFLLCDIQLGFQNGEVNGAHIEHPIHEQLHFKLVLRAEVERPGATEV